LNRLAPGNTGGRMLYSGLDCIRVGILGDTTKLSVSPVAAKMVTSAASNRIRKLMLLNKRAELKERKEPLFMIFHNVSEKEASGNTEYSASKLAEKYKEATQPFLVVPVDNSYWYFKGRVIETAIESELLPEGFTFK